MSLNQRLQRVQALLKEQNWDTLIVSSPGNLYYLTGQYIDPHERLLTIVIQRDSSPHLIAPKLHEGDFVDWSYPLTLWEDGIDTIGELLQHFPKQPGTIAVDPAWPSSFLLSLLDRAPSHRYVTAGAGLSSLRRVKDSEEIDKLILISKWTDEVMEELWSKIQPGMTEREVAKQLAQLWENRGVTQPSFPTIVGAGANGALPHHATDDSVLNVGDLVVIDMGAKYNGYCSDTTRTVAIGEISDEQRQVYSIVERAQEAAFQAVAVGKTTGEIDEVARQVIREAGYEQWFIHGTGHGVGIDLHEEPNVKPGTTTVIQPGMVFSIEPGIYLPGKFGVRIEDLVAIQLDGTPYRMNQLTRSLTQI